MPENIRPRINFWRRTSSSHPGVITHNAQVTKAVETERFLDENQPYLE